MMRRISRMLNAAPAQSERLSMNEWLSSFGFNGQSYPVGALGVGPAAPPTDLAGRVAQIHRQNGVVAAAVEARALLISQIRPVWRNNDRTSDDFGSLGGSDRTLERRRDSRNGAMTRQELLHAAEIHVSYSGNAYFGHRQLAGKVDNGSTIELLRPDLVDPVYLGTEQAPQAIVGYQYHREGRDKNNPESWDAKTVAHWRPEPHPLNPFIGESWVTAVVQEILTDQQATKHLQAFFKNGATPRTVVRPDKTLTAEQIKEFQGLFEESNAGVANAYKTWFIGGGSDVNVIGSSLSDMDLRHITGGFETRLSVRSRVPAAVLGIREGLQGSALNSGNYSATRRLWADTWFTPTADSLCSTLEQIASRPANHELTFDPDAVLFLQEDQKDAAEVMSQRASAVRNLTEAGYEADAIIRAVSSGNLKSLLGSHTGLTSVQLTPPETSNNDD